MAALLVKNSDPAFTMDETMQMLAELNNCAMWYLHGKTAENKVALEVAVLDSTELLKEYLKIHGRKI